MSRPHELRPDRDESLVADPRETVTDIVARPEVLELRDSDGTVVTTLDYMGSVADAIAALTTVFGASPSDEPYEKTNHFPAGVYHSWEAFVLDERFYDEDRRKQAQIFDVTWPRFAVYFDAPTALDIVLSTVQGYRAGDAWSEVSADAAFDSSIRTCAGTPIEAVAVATSPDGDWRSTVVVVPTDEGATVRWIGAPQTEVDGCA